MVLVFHMSKEWEFCVARHANYVVSMTHFCLAFLIFSEPVSPGRDLEDSNKCLSKNPNACRIFCAIKIGKGLMIIGKLMAFAPLPVYHSAITIKPLSGLFTGRCEYTIMLTNWKCLNLFGRGVREIEACTLQISVCF